MFAYVLVCVACLGVWLFACLVVSLVACFYCLCVFVCLVGCCLCVYVWVCLVGCVFVWLRVCARAFASKFQYFFLGNPTHVAKKRGGVLVTILGWESSCARRRA